MKAFLTMSKSIFSNIFLMLILKKILCLRGNVLYNVIVKKKKRPFTRTKQYGYNDFKTEDFKND